MAVFKISWSKYNEKLFSLFSCKLQQVLKIYDWCIYFVYFVLYLLRMFVYGEWTVNCKLILLLTILKFIFNNCVGIYTGRVIFPVSYTQICLILIMCGLSFLPIMSTPCILRTLGDFSFIFFFILGKIATYQSWLGHLMCKWLYKI